MKVRRTPLPCPNAHVPSAVFSGKHSVEAVAVDEVIGERDAGSHVRFGHQCGWVDVPDDTCWMAVLLLILRSLDRLILCLSGKRIDSGLESS